ncbi:hypothetical protein DXG01_008997 [Tephrocybe rancida]|nr:hypothetical protein DXG01_008997 [Tephrocybe rancida]
MSTTSATITLNDGARVPWLAFGTGTALYGKDAAKLVRVAIDNGISHLDGAQSYSNEDTLGAGIKASGKSRSDLFIVTKLKRLQPGQTVKESLKESLKKLDVDFVDLFLIHDPTPARQEGGLKELWKAMEQVKKEGLTKSIGVSNFKVEDLKEILEIAEIVPAVNQVGYLWPTIITIYAFYDVLLSKIELHPYVWKAAEPIVNLSKEKGIVIASYGGQTPVARVPDGPVDEVLVRLRERLTKTYGQPVTSGQVLSKWLIQKGVIVVTTTSKVSRIKEFLGTEAIPDLTAEEIRAIEEAGEKLHKRIFMGHVFGE